MNPRLRGSAAHVFVDSINAPSLSPEDEHHLRRVLRISSKDRVTASDGQGRWLEACISAAGLEPTSPVVEEPPPRRAALLTAIPKGDRLEWLVQKVTELGVTDLTFVDCARSVVRWDSSRAEKQLARLRRVAREAAMQSRRAWLPVVHGVVPFDGIPTGDVALADPDGELERPPDVEAIVVGPEGGFTEAELAAVPRRIALGAHVLRVETAAIAAVMILTYGH